MTEQINLAIQWLQANPDILLAIIVYLVLNFVSRPDPDKLSGLDRLFWTIIDRAAFLTRDKLPGRLKMVLLSASASSSGSKNEPDDGAADDEPVEKK